MKRLFRLTARILDYAWCFGFIYSILDLLSASIYSYAVTALLMPLIFMPFEVLCLTLFRSTFGKLLFGYRYHRRVKFKEALVISCKKAFLLQPLFLPGINIVFALFYARELKKYKTNRWDQINGCHMIHGRMKWYSHLSTFAIALVISTFTLAPEPLVERGAKLVGLETASFIQDFSFFKPGDWTKVTPKDSSFSIFFPNAPNLDETDHDVPNSSKKLHVVEYSHKGDMQYCLTYSKLPSSWTFFGSSMVFKTAIKLVQDKSGGDIHKQKRCSHMRFPALHYHGKAKKSHFQGKLILVKNTLFRVEVTSEKPFTEEQTHNNAEKFFNSFYPKA